MELDALKKALAEAIKEARAVADETAELKGATVNSPTAVASSKGDSAYRAALAARNQDFALLRDIAKAQKHVRLTQGNPLVSQASQITSRPIGYGEGGFGEGRYGGCTQVVVDIDTNEFRYLESVIDASLDFLKTEMQTLDAY